MQDRDLLGELRQLADYLTVTDVHAASVVNHGADELERAIVLPEPVRARLEEAEKAAAERGHPDSVYTLALDGILAFLDGFEAALS